MLSAFVLPHVNGGWREFAIGITGPSQTGRATERKLNGEAWDVAVYDSPDALSSPIRNREVMGGIAPGSGGVDV